ncbi:MAG: TetR family transcriptional regulator [Actinomycetota bacterium]
MADGPLTPERILEASQDVLRRYGPAKATVVDVARELGVSHGSVYRHFPSKAALRDAVAERWLAGVSEPLAEIANEDGPAPDRLRRWLDLLVESKQSRAREDAELFATYVQIAGESREVITEHVNALVAQLARIVADGVEQGAFVAPDASGATRAVFDATARFHNPANAVSWSDPGIATAYDQVVSLVLAGLSAPT